METRPIRDGCDERFKTLFRKEDEQDTRLDDHDKQLAKMLSVSAAFDERFKSLIVEIERTNNNIEKQAEQNKWFMRILVGAFISFFFYAVQSGVL